MFFRQRILQAEHFDSPDRPPAELAEAYDTIARINRLFFLDRPYRELLPELLGEQSCRSLSLLDVGGGDGSFGNELGRWASERGWDWRFTNLDVNVPALRLHAAPRAVAASALALPLRDASFDVVTASQMAHHIDSERDVCRHLAEAWRVTGRVLLCNDLHRSLPLYVLLAISLRLARCPGHFISDALISVRRGWRVREWRELAARAGIPKAKVWLYSGSRVMLLAKKS